MAAGVLVTLTSAPAPAADPTSCPWANDANHALYTWMGGTNDNIWGFAANWSAPAGNPAVVPNDDRQGMPTPGYDENEPGEVADTHNTYVCVPAGSTVNIDANTTRFAFVQAIWVGAGSTFNIRRGAGLFVQSESASVSSFFSANTDLNVVAGSLGGRGTLKSQGRISIRSPLNGGGGSTLSTKVANNETAASIGELVVGSTATMTLPERGVGVRYGYDLTIEGKVLLTQDVGAVSPGDGFLGAAWGTRTEIMPGGTLEIADDGGYYQGSQQPGVTQLSDLVNNGLLVKSAGSGTSVIDADYQGAGSVQVDSGVLALPDGSAVGTGRAAGSRTDPTAARAGGEVTGGLGKGATLATGRCQAGAIDLQTGSCTLVVNAADPSAVSVKAPTTQGVGDVVIDEQAADGDVLFAHGGAPVARVQLGDFEVSGTPVQPDRLHPARIALRYATSFFGAGTTVDDVDVVRSPVAGSTRTVLPDCAVGGVVDAGRTSCIDRDASDDETTTEPGNITLVVLVAEASDSRYIIRKEQTPVGITGSVSGAAVVDQTLSVARAFDPEPTSTSVVWAADGIPIPGSAGQPAITLGAAEAGKTITVTVSAQALDWAEGHLTLNAGKVSKGVTHGHVSLTGTPRVGKRLQAIATYDQPGLVLSYEWFRVRGATRTRLSTTKAFYKLRANDVGYKIRVQVTATSAGYEDTEGAIANSRKIKQKQRR